jgi:hypothetical protein
MKKKKKHRRMLFISCADVQYIEYRILVETLYTHTPNKGNKIIISSIVYYRILHNIIDILIFALIFVS